MRFYGKPSGNRFNDYRELTAHHETTPDRTACGHAVRKGDLIGFCRGRIRCAVCWARWKAENAEAQAMEQGWMK